MTLELIDIALLERHNHPRLPHRVTGKVRAVLVETIGERPVEHDITVPVWLDVEEGAVEDDVDLAMLVKAADIIGRVKGQLANADMPSKPIVLTPAVPLSPVQFDPPIDPTDDETER